jgi:hypothetical protein
MYQCKHCPIKRSTIGLLTKHMWKTHPEKIRTIHMKAIAKRNGKLVKIEEQSQEMTVTQLLLILDAQRTDIERTTNLIRAIVGVSQ